MVILWSSTVHTQFFIFLHTTTTAAVFRLKHDLWFIRVIYIDAATVAWYKAAGKWCIHLNIPCPWANPRASIDWVVCPSIDNPSESPAKNRVCVLWAFEKIGDWHQGFDWRPWWWSPSIRAPRSPSLGWSSRSKSSARASFLLSYHFVLQQPKKKISCFLFLRYGVAVAASFIKATKRKQLDSELM